MSINLFILNISVYQMSQLTWKNRNLTLHLEQVLPIYFSLQGHCPVNSSHLSLKEPNGLQSQAESENWYLVESTTLSKLQFNLNSTSYNIIFFAKYVTNLYIHRIVDCHSNPPHIHHISSQQYCPSIVSTPQFYDHTNLNGKDQHYHYNRMADKNHQLIRDCQNNRYCTYNQ